MKQLKVFLHEGFELMTSDADRMWRGMDSYAMSKGCKTYMGGCGFSNTRHDLSLYFPTGDQPYIKDAMAKKLKAGEVLFRYATPTVKAGGMLPLVKINIRRGLIYYNQEDASEEDILVWRTRGEKLRYINLRDDFTQFMKTWMHGGGINP